MMVYEDFRILPDYDDFEINQSGVVRRVFDGRVYSTKQAFGESVNFTSHGVRHHKGIRVLLKSAWPENF